MLQLGTSQKLVYTAFPFETITTAASRNAVMSAVLTLFGLAQTVSVTPGTPDLDPSRDSGSSNSDNITNFNNTTGKALIFDISGTTTGSTVNVLIDGTVVGTATAAGSVTAVITNATSTLTDGQHTVTATQTQPGSLLSNPSTGMTVTIDTTAPTVSPLTFNYDASQSLVYTFNEAMASSFSASSVTVTNLTSNSAVTTSGSYDTNSKTVTFTFPNGILASANYQASLNSAAITDLAGNALAGASAGSFFFQMADANRDRSVNALDFNILASNFGLSGKTFTQGNFNYDGAVDTADFTALATAFGPFWRRRRRRHWILLRRLPRRKAPRPLHCSALIESAVTIR